MMLTDYLITAVSYLKHRSKRTLIKYSYGLQGLKGLEIGGPSAFFSLKGHFPVYLFAAEIDGVNYSNQTVWEGSIQQGRNYRYYNKTGYQYIKEASDLNDIQEGNYDFVLSCHSLEHVANPLKALAEWRRVLRKNGTLVLVLPDKRHTFDINRPYTTIKHLLDDRRNNVGEDDPTHYQESIELHDLSLDNGVSSKQEHAERIKNNITTRCVHHHVFSLELIREMLTAASFKVIYQQEAAPFHLITIARKTDAPAKS